MARKVFISILGAGFYGACYYVHENGTKSKKTRFIQEAMIDHYNVRSWRKKSEGIGYIFLTDFAKSQNWIVPNGKRLNNTIGKEEDYVGLDSLIGKCVETVWIPDGKNKEELWEMFSIIYSKLMAGDELYIDLTHAFRYLPMLLLVLCNYAKFLKKVKMKAITYGNYEARNKDTNEAPIVDLLPLSQLQDWTFAAANFIENGDVSRLIDLSNSKYVEDIGTFINQMRFCRGREIYNPKSLYEAGKITGETLPTVLPPILEKINESVPRSKFTQQGNAWNCIYAAEWCYKMKQYQAAVTMLQEGVVTFLCEQCGYPVDDEDKRELISASLEMAKKGRFTPKRDKNGNLKIEEKDVKATMQKAKLPQTGKKPNIVTYYDDLRHARNDFNHAGMIKNKNQEDWGSCKKGIDAKITELGEIINNIKKELRRY